MRDTEFCCYVIALQLEAPGVMHAGPREAPLMRHFIKRRTGLRAAGGWWWVAGSCDQQWCLVWLAGNMLLITPFRLPNPRYKNRTISWTVDKLLCP